MADEIIYKRPTEIYTYSYDFTPKLQGDTTIAAGSAVTAIDDEGNAITSILGTKAVSGMSLSCPLKLGTDGRDYTITFNGIGSTTSDERQWVVEMRVRSKVGGVV